MEGQLNKQNFNSIVDLSKPNTTLLEFKRQFHCSFLMMSYLISFKEKNTITVNEIKNVLIEIMNELVTSNLKLKF